MVTLNPKKDFIKNLFYEKYNNWVRARNYFEREIAWNEYWPVRDIYFGFSYDYFSHFNFQHNVEVVNEAL